MLTRIYGTAFAKQERPRRLSEADRGSGEARPPQARPRDGSVPFPGRRPRRRVLASEGLDASSSASSPICAAVSPADYQEVNAPQILDKSLWETSGHWDWYRENMFAAQSAGDEAEDKRWFALKPMNCPGHVQIFKHGLKSYRDLPLRLAEFGVVHRYEPSGAHARADARARLHAGRRACVLHRGAARRRVPQDQRAYPVDLCRFRLRRDRGQALDAAREARRHRRDVGPRRSA